MAAKDTSQKITFYDALSLLSAMLLNLRTLPWTEPKQEFILVAYSEPWYFRFGNLRY